MFKTKVYVRLINGAQPLTITQKGDWIDLRSNVDLYYKGISVQDGKVVLNKELIPLGIAVKMPKGMEGIVAPRSSTYKTYGIISWNSIGVIDNCYNGTNDEWKFGAILLQDGHISKGDRICQFRIQLSQKATMWQKLKWLLSGGKIEICYVDELLGTDRSGFGGGTGAR